MRSFRKLWMPAAAAACLLIGGAAMAQDKEAVIKNRAALMKEQSKDLGKVKAFLEGKGELAAAQAGAEGLVQTMKKIPDVFPPGTAGPDPTGDYAAKPEIWSDWNKFLQARDTAAAKVEVLIAAVKKGDKSEIQTAFGDLGKNGCGACHTAFREKLKN